LAWANTEKAQDLFSQMKAHETQRKIFEKQAKQLEDEGSRKNPRHLRQAFIELFTTSKLGLGITFTGAGRRDTSEQSEFRSQLIKVYDSNSPNTISDSLWCPITKEWWRKGDCTAAHLFGYMHGQAAMDAIFGPANPPELFSPSNGLIMSSAAEELFDDGIFVIIPTLPDDPSEEEIKAWNQSNPKDYKVKILDMANPRVKKLISPYSNKIWRDLDNEVLEFRSSFRPRARYLYFHYCCQILKKSWKEKSQGQILKEEFGKLYWATPGRYMRRNMLLAFVEELGHEYEKLLEGCMEDDDDASTLIVDGDSDILLAAASDQIKESIAKKDANYDDESEDSDSDDEESSI
jgi:hypothetical protein